MKKPSPAAAKKAQPRHNAPKLPDPFEVLRAIYLESLGKLAPRTF